MLRRNNRLLLARVHGWLRADVHRRLRARIHELLLRRLLELLRPDRVYELLLGRLVPWLLGRSRSHTFVGLADDLCRVLPNSVRSVVRAERLLVVPIWIRDQLRPGVLELFKLLSLLGFAMQHLCVICTSTVQFLFDLHRRICSVLSMRFVVRLQRM